MNQWTMILSPATDLWWSDHPFSKRSLTFANEGNKPQSHLQVLSVNKWTINNSIIWIIHVRALLCLINRFQQLPSSILLRRSDPKNHPHHGPIRASTPGTINHVFGRTCGKKYPPALGGTPTGKVFSKGRKRANFPKAKCIYIYIAMLQCYAIYLSHIYDLCLTDPKY